MYDLVANPFSLIYVFLHPVLTCSLVDTLGYLNILLGGSKYALASLFVSYQQYMLLPSKPWISTRVVAWRCHRCYWRSIRSLKTWTSNSDIIRIHSRVNKTCRSGLLFLPLDPVSRFIELLQRRRSPLGVSLKLRSSLLNQRSMTLLLHKQRGA